jgi:hypothetical protein
MNKITIIESINIAASPEKVWDYTQDWKNRAQWDDSVVEVVSQMESPKKFVRAKFKGGMIFDIEYKLNERPKITSLAMVNGSSKMFVGGGGSWKYEGKDGGTEWIQTDTLVLSDNWFLKLFAPLFKFSLQASTRKAMKKAKRLLEA